MVNALSESTLFARGRGSGHRQAEFEYTVPPPRTDAETLRNQWKNSEVDLSYRLHRLNVFITCRDCRQHSHNRFAFCRPTVWNSLPFATVAFHGMPSSGGWKFISSDIDEYRPSPLWCLRVWRRLRTSGHTTTYTVSLFVLQCALCQANN